MFVEDFLDFGNLAARAAASFSSCVLLGGSFGNAAGSYSGARMVYRSELEVNDVPLDIAENEVSAVAVDLIESLLSLLVITMSDVLRLCIEGVSEGLRGGSAGELPAGREGNAGGAFDAGRAGSAGVCWEEAVAVRGGSDGRCGSSCS